MTSFSSNTAFDEEKKEESPAQKDARLRAEEYRKRTQERRKREQDFADQQRFDLKSRVGTERESIAQNLDELREKGFAKQEQIQERLVARTGEVPAVPVTSDPYGSEFSVSIGKQQGTMRTEAGVVGGQQSRFISTQKGQSFNPQEWESILADPVANKEAIDVLGNTTDAISKLETPEARQFTKLYNQIEADRKQIEQNTSLTARERASALSGLRERQGRLAADIPNLGDIPEQLERQLMAQEKAEADTARSEAAAKLRDYESAYTAAEKIAEKQISEGIDVSPEQFRDIFASEVAKREAIANYISGRGEVAGPPEPVESVDLTYSNPTGGLVYGAGAEGKPYVRIEGAGPAGPRIPTRTLNGVVYPAPATADQVGKLHKGTTYFPPGAATLSIKKSGPDAPNEAALKIRAQEEQDRVKFEQDTYQDVLSKQTFAYENFINETLPETFAAMRVAALEAGEDFSLTPQDILAGRALDVLGETTDIYDVRTLQTIMNPPVDPNTEAGREERLRRLDLALDIREQVAEHTRAKNVANQERSAPYENSISAFTPKIAEGKDVVTYTTDEGKEVDFEAYTITQSGSKFYGKSLPVIRNSSELMQVSPNLYPNFAYYNPEAGRVLASVAAKGSQRGEYTRGEASTIMSQLVELYPADFFDNPGDFEEVFDAFTQYMGYSGPQR